MEIEVNGKNYQIERLLGKGKGGYSYLARDNDKPIVIKQIHHEPCSYYQFGDKLSSELRDYQTLKEIGIPLPKLIEVDQEKERIVKEYIEGLTVLELVKEDRLPEDCLRQVEDMCRLLYPAGINIDYFPTNFVLEDGKLYYIDYECNNYMQEWNFENWGILYWSKTPELLAYLKENPDNN